MPEVSVLFRPAYDAGIARSVLVRADGDRNFLDALCELVGLPWQRDTAFFYLIVLPDTEDAHSWQIDQGLSLAEMAAFAGDSEIVIDNGGRGGGTVPLVSDLLNAALNIAAVSALVKWGGDALSYLVNRPRQQAARKWVTGPLGTGAVPSAELQNSLRKYPALFLNDVQRQYGLDAGAAAMLLRGSGFVKTPDDPHGYPEYWTRSFGWEQPSDGAPMLEAE